MTLSPPCWWTKTKDVSFSFFCSSTRSRTFLYFVIGVSRAEVG